MNSLRGSTFSPMRMVKISSAFTAILELVADQFIDFFPWDPMTYLFLAYFVVPGFIEEGVKNRVLRKRTWYDPNFNYRFDGIVYGVFVSLGFAGVENVWWSPTAHGGSSRPSP